MALSFYDRKRRTIVYLNPGQSRIHPSTLCGGIQNNSYISSRHPTPSQACSIIVTSPIEPARIITNTDSGRKDTYATMNLILPAHTGPPVAPPRITNTLFITNSPVVIEKDKSIHSQHGVIHYPFYYGGLASCVSSCCTQPLGVGKS